MTGMRPGRLQVTAPTTTTIVMRRAFAAPPALVFACLTEPDLLRQWRGADGWDTVTATYASREVRDAVLASPMERGVDEGYRALDALLARLSESP